MPPHEILSEEFRGEFYADIFLIVQVTNTRVFQKMIVLQNIVLIQMM